MGKKKKKRAPEVLYWCYYCDRVFKDEGTLIQHQKAKHFRCMACTRKLNTAQGLQVHCDQVHKINVERVPAAKPDRDSMDREIFGMAGVPEGMKPGGVFDEPPAKRAALEGAESPPPLPMQPSLQGDAAVAQRPPPMMSANAAGPLMPRPMYVPQVQPHQPMGMPPNAHPHGIPNIYAPPQYTMGYGSMQRPPGPVHGILPHPRPLPGVLLPRMQGVPPPAPPGTVPTAGRIVPMSQPLGPPPGVIQAHPARPPGQAPAPASILAPGMHHGTALFPIVAPAMPQAPPQPPPKTAAAEAGVAAEADVAELGTNPAGGGDLELLWKDEEFSMEEQRAKLPKYAAHLQHRPQVSEVP